ncbi:glycosyltransferase family 4 protein [Thermasporomyces composti]|uniref:Glycosyltransferase involved in cell wall biosynthesis n=1 Tax=Thermasporomyces composti TaxID=696763 RepID=A0A3D9VKT9_THECX|nr:glycosyltransferase family 4 protein [Thermasporomyces composti]REF37991.1 glycosyltransferase involved in cell wall biosynthesis [Thermasporomyces composti]
MRVALVATTGFTVPPPRYGGINRVVKALADGLVDRGVDVTLFAAGGSRTRARLRAVPERPVSELPLAERSRYQRYQQQQLLAVARAAGEFDLIHSHVEHLLPLARRDLPAPLLTTMHNPLDDPGKRALLATLPEVLAVSLSYDQRRPVADLPQVRWMGNAYEGVEGAHLHLGTGEGDERGPYFCYLGRVERRRDVAGVIDIAVRAGVRLKVAGSVYPADLDYWKTEVEPRLRRYSDQVEWLGELDDAEKGELLRGAQALLMPSRLREAFGLVFVESLACGTPVIARPRGSLPEIVRDGVHGYLREDVDDLVAACRRLARDPSVIDRRACHAWARRHFSVEAMVDTYLRIYERTIAYARTRSATAAVKTRA